MLSWSSKRWAHRALLRALFGLALATTLHTSRGAPSNHQEQPSAPAAATTAAATTAAASPQRNVVHVLVLWSPPQRALLEAWQRKLNDAIQGDPLHTYVVHAECHRFDHTSGNGTYSDLQWSAAVARKVSFAREVAAALPLRSTLLMSDVDVLLFAPLGPVLAVHRSSGNGVTFLSEAENFGVNTGFYLLTVSEATRRFLAAWDDAVPTLPGIIKNDQITMNRWMKHVNASVWHRHPPSAAEVQPGACKGCPADEAALRSIPRVGAFPLWMAAAKTSYYCQDTVVGHLIGVAGTDRKLAALPRFQELRDQAASKVCGEAPSRRGRQKPVHV